MEEDRGYKIIPSKLFVYVILLFIFSGCTGRYHSVPFSWTSEHRIPPHERILTLKASPQSTFNALQNWVKDHNGTILNSSNDYLYVYDMPPQSKEKYQALQAFTQKYWESFDTNTRLDWNAAEWAQLKEMTGAQQINKIKSDTPGFILEARMGERTGSFNYTEQVNTQPGMTPVYNPGFTSYQRVGSGIRTVTIPGTMMFVPTYTPVYAQRTKTMCFDSSISFYIFSRNNSTYVYAFGAPVSGEGEHASYDKTIGHAWWNQITGKEEAALIKDAYAYLTKLDNTGELKNIKADITGTRNVSEKILAERIDSTIKPSITVSPDSKHIAYTIKRENKSSVVIDVREEKQYDSIGAVVFSPDSKHVAYAAQTGDKWSVVVDGKEGRLYDSLWKIFFSTDGRRVAYAAQTDSKWRFVIDEKEEKQYENLKSVVFSPDSSHMAYTAQAGNKWLVVSDGKEEKQYDSIETVIFSPDSKHMAYAAKAGNKWFVVTDGKEGKQYDSIWKIFFSPDSEHMAYAAQNGNKWFVVSDGKEEKQYDSLTSVVFSPDSKRIAYGAKTGTKWFVVLDGKEEKQYDNLGAVIFSPDSLHVAYAAQNGNKWFMVVNKKEEKQYDNLGTPFFSPDNRQIAYKALQCNKWFMVVNGKEEKPYDDIIGAINTFDSPDSLHYVARYDNRIYLVEEKLK
ncbi:MAG: WD40 repeat domain-containing protein [Syntrophaceae bacterium]